MQHSTDFRTKDPRRPWRPAACRDPSGIDPPADRLRAHPEQAGRLLVREPFVVGLETRESRLQYGKAIQHGPQSIVESRTHHRKQAGLDRARAHSAHQQSHAAMVPIGIVVSLETVVVLPLDMGTSGASRLPMNSLALPRSSACNQRSLRGGYPHRLASPTSGGMWSWSGFGARRSAREGERPRQVRPSALIASIAAGIGSSGSANDGAESPPTIDGARPVSHEPGHGRERQGHHGRDPVADGSSCP